MEKYSNTAGGCLDILSCTAALLWVPVGVHSLHTKGLYSLARARRG